MQIFLKVQVEKRVESGVNVNQEVNVAAIPVETQGTYAGSNSHTHYGFSGGFDQQGGSKLINDIFNVSNVCSNKKVFFYKLISLLFRFQLQLCKQ